MIRVRRLIYRWLVTVFLTALSVTIVEIYKAKGNFTSKHKGAFNTIILVLILVLGLNFFEALKELPEALKNSLFQLTPIEEEHSLIEDIGSQLAVWRLLRRLWRRGESASKMLVAYCVGSLFLNLIAQVTVAATSLSYTINDGTTYNDTYTTRGTVIASDVSCYYMEFLQGACPQQVTAQTVAHSYGEMILASRLVSSYDNISEVLESKQASQYYHRRTRNQQQVAYRFKEYNSQDIGKSYPYFTDRIITAEAKNCITYDDNGSDNKDPRTFNYTNPKDANDKGTIQVSESFLGNKGTTYIYQGFHDPANANLQSCGPRCVWMWAYKNPSADKSEPSAFYKCPVNISAVTNAHQLHHSISDGLAKIAAAAIALQGRFADPANDPSERDYHSYQFYANGDPWDIHNKDADEVGDRFALFALGSLANMATLNPVIRIPGTVPHLGHSIHVYEPWFAILWTFIVGGHLAVLVATLIGGWRRRRGQERLRW